MDTGLIILDELLRNSNIEPSFLVLLEDEGLIEITIIEGKQYISESQLGDLRRFADMYYDLSINVEGIDVIHNLLNRMSDMELELMRLRKLMDFHRGLWDDSDIIENL